VRQFAAFLMTYDLQDSHLQSSVTVYVDSKMSALVVVCVSVSVSVCVCMCVC
jgi:hypothetical protein